MLPYLIARATGKVHIASPAVGAAEIWAGSQASQTGLPLPNSVPSAHAVPCLEHLTCHMMERTPWGDLWTERKFNIKRNFCKNWPKEDLEGSLTRAWELSPKCVKLSCREAESAGESPPTKIRILQKCLILIENVAVLTSCK